MSPFAIYILKRESDLGDIRMVEVSDFNEGDILRSEYNQFSRELSREYSLAIGYKNITYNFHINDKIAELGGLKGVIVHGSFYYGLMIKMFEELLGFNKYGTIIETDIEFKGLVRCGDNLVSKAIIKKVEGKRVYYEFTQISITPIEIKDENGQTVKVFEAAERGYVSKKDIKEGYVKTKKVDEGILTYRERLATRGYVIIELFS